MREERVVRSQRIPRQHVDLHEVAVRAFWDKVELSHPLSWITSNTQGEEGRESRQVMFRYLSQELSALCPGLFLSITTPPGKPELVITANGDPFLFASAHAVVAAAPARLRREVDIHALRRAQGFYGSIRIEGETLSPHSVKYQSFTKRPGVGLDLAIFVPGFRSLDCPKSARLAGAVYIMLDHALGEESVATELGEIIFRPEEEMGPSAKSILYLQENVCPPIS